MMFLDWGQLFKAGDEGVSGSTSGCDGGGEDDDLEDINLFEVIKVCNIYISSFVPSCLRVKPSRLFSKPLFQSMMIEMDVVGPGRQGRRQEAAACRWRNLAPTCREYRLYCARREFVQCRFNASDSALVINWVHKLPRSST
jgi:hypothetical protein